MQFTFDPPDDTAWFLNAFMQILPNPTAPSQPNALRIAYQTGQNANATRTLSGLVVGQSYDVWAWVNFDNDSQGRAVIRISYNDSPSELRVDLRKMRDPDTDEPLDLGWELRFVGVLHYNFADRTFRVQGPPLTTALASTDVDTIYIGEEPITAEHLSKRRQIREALIARIQSVTIPNGYGVTVQTVSTGTVRIPDGIENTPHVSVLYPDQEFAIQAMQRIRGVARFIVGIAVKRTDDNDPEDLLDDTYADVCRAVTIGPIDPAANGMWLGLPWIHYVFISGEESEQLPEEMSGDIAALNVFVDVHYNFEHGNF